MSIPIAHFGLHEHEGINYLVQGSGDIQNPYKLDDKPKFKLARQSWCPHNIELFPITPVGFDKFFNALPKKDELINVLSPTRKVGTDIYIIRNTGITKDLLYHMSQMGSPTLSTIKLLRTSSIASLIPLIVSTNISTLIIDITGVEPKKVKILLDEIKYNPRRVLLLMEDNQQPKPANTIEIKTKIKKLRKDFKVAENWRALGAKLLKESIL